MKKTLILVTALLAALVAGELVVRYLVGFPEYGVKYKVHYRQGPDYWTNVWLPYSRYWNVEGGNHVFQRNNLGLPGTDVRTGSQTHIAVLGSSFIEAYQINPKLIATSLFDSLLHTSGKDVAVYNLGCSNHDPYDMWFRLKYFERQYKFDYIILVLETDFANRLGRYKLPLSFEPDGSFGKINNSTAVRYLTLLRNHSTLLSVIFQCLGSPKSEFGVNTSIVKAERALNYTPELDEILRRFAADYGERFALVTIFEQPEFTNVMKSACWKNRIRYNNKPLFRPEIMIKGAGHLNDQGNHELGQVLFEAYGTFWGLETAPVKEQH
jgi:hypothetical protein